MMSIIGEAATVKLPSPYSSLTEPYVEYYTDNNGIDVRVVVHNMKYVQNQMFMSHTNLKSVTILSGTISIGQKCFENCTALTQIILPSTLTTIDDTVFRECTALTELRIPSSVSRISGYNIFYNVKCPLYFYSTTPPTAGVSTFYNYKGSYIYVPSTSIEAYKAATYWSKVASKIYEMED